ncbi:hypothetical protein GUITHDRAFT_148146 [Guillardia theta CCMP2712]|uniref:MORN repeat-containing protein 5 n=1 Tax=Guillardia theta (strain CCMP2712) TaxID=905079 RepID=L1IB34_GUITC|nr:hypothetical protein GUITHDRAFT_148146 [Guillardia theta CCMP2712]EKX33129.1 hypothetical protein GUITHDRAFT_148146 [Guillardia theta CCMP2712]|eukprot:XP_005820109.1 hypothetical protein GUITHDRAFT_148146 [Guillardia theta CCMP2712]
MGKNGEDVRAEKSDQTRIKGQEKAVIVGRRGYRAISKAREIVRGGDDNQITMMNGIGSGSYFETGKEKSNGLEEEKMDLGSLMQTQTQLKMESTSLAPNQIPAMNDLSSDEDDMQKAKLAGISEEADDEDDDQDEEAVDYFVTEDFVSGGTSGAHCCCCHGISAEKLEGAHRINNKDGSSYNGEWVQGKWEGNGRWSHQDSGTYDGMWRDGLFQGSGIFIFPDGDMFEGKFRGGCPIAGLLTKANGLRAKVTFDGKRTIFDKNLTPLKQTVLKGRLVAAETLYFWGLTVLGHRKKTELVMRGNGREWKNGLIFGRGNFKFPNGKEIMADFEDSCPVAGTIKAKKLASRQRVKFDGKTSVFDPNFWNSLKLAPMMLTDEEPTDSLLTSKQSPNGWQTGMGSSSESIMRLLKKSGSHAEHIKNRNPHEPRKRLVTFGPGV